MVELNQLSPPRGSRKKPQRVGRGIGARKSKTAGRGNKGQLSRSGRRMRPGFEGGQMPLHRRLPKRGFTNIFKKRYALVNLKDLQEFKTEEKITPELLVQRGLIKRLGDGLKVLGDGELKAPLHITAHLFSKAAREKIQNVGGTAEVIPA